MARNSGRKNRGQDLAQVDPNAWMVTFADLVMLLLTFFVLLLTMKSMDTGKVRTIFNIAAATQGPMSHSAVSPRVSPIDDAQGAPRIDTLSDSRLVAEAVELLNGIQRVKAENPEMAAVLDLLGVSEDQRGVVISLEADHLFASGEAVIRPQKLPILEGIKKVLRFAANQILIMGHSDRQPVVGGRFASNWELSLERALSVHAVLTAPPGLDPAQLGVGGYGDRRPLFGPDTPENRARNRRVEFILRKPN
ncbi:MAG: OmpA family protein [Desulfobacteraceae bacterium]|nr:OmpA family protein [Desulfobacteraceae bacterium]